MTLRRQSTSRELIGKVDDMRFGAPEERTDVPRPARLIGPDDFGLNSRIDVYRHDGADENGDEYADRITLVFDDEMIERAAKAMWGMSEPPEEWDNPELAYLRTDMIDVVKTVLRVALGGLDA